MPSPDRAPAGRLRGAAIAWLVVGAAVACALLQGFAEPGRRPETAAAFAASLG